MDDIPPLSDLHRSLEAVADATLLFDNHAHPFWIHPNPQPVQPLSHVLTEAYPPLQTSEVPSDQHASTSPLPRSSLSFRRSLKDMHHLLSEPAHSSVASSYQSTTSAASPAAEEADNTGGGRHGNGGGAVGRELSTFETACETERTVEGLRTEMGIWALAKRCFEAAGVAAVLIDDGLRPPEGSRSVSCDEFVEQLGVGVAKRLLRLESEAEDVLKDLIDRNEGNLWVRSGEGKRARTILRARMFRRAFWERLDPLPERVVGFKSIVAYRGGLDVRLDWTEEELEEALGRVTGGEKLVEKVVVDFVVKWGMEAARMHGVPVQFHCGFGDRDLHVVKSDPSLLREMLETFTDVSIVLLHAAWPFMRKAAYLTAVYPNVYLDLGLAIPLLSVRGMLRAVDEALEIAPVNKLVYSSDAHSTPDAFYLAARWSRRVVAAAVAASVISGDLSLPEAKVAVRMILAENAIRLYKLPVDV